MGYVVRAPDPRDAATQADPADRAGVDCLRRSAQIFDQLRAGWAETLGDERLRALEDDLRAVTPKELLRLDMPGWFGG